MTEVVIKALSITTNTQTGEAVGEIVVPVMAGLPAVQVMARVLSIAVKLIAIKVVGETVGKTGDDGETAALWWPFQGWPIHWEYSL